MSHKTKAAMQGRQCHYQKLKQSQDTRVNAGGQSLSAPVITGTAPLALLRGKLAYRINNFYSVLRVTKSHAQNRTQIWGEPDKQAGCTAINKTTENFRRYPNIGYRCEENRIGQNQSYKNSGGQTPEDFQSAFMHFGYQPFGSMPRCFNSFLTIRLSHAERVASPSSCMAATIASSSAGSTRKAICLLPLGIFMFDMCLTLGVIFVVSNNVHHVSDTCKARSPAVLPALTGPLTTNRYTR